MTIHREGRMSIALAIVFVGIVNLLNMYLLWPLTPLGGWVLFIASLLFLFAIIYFFRIPERAYTKDPCTVVSPCDGKVVVIEEMTDTEYYHEKRLQVSIFMSPLNVHVNRIPISGEVVYTQYHKGKYLVAWHPKSSVENERHSVVIRAGGIEILVKQIAGAMAKRIVNYLQVGQKVTQSEELGFIKFGSRVDLLLPPGTKVNVKLNEVVKGGITSIATLP